MENIIEIEIVNWEKYNPRSDRGGFSWFRMDNQFFLHMRQRKGYSSDATTLMAFLLAEASSNNGRPFKLRLGFAGEMIGRTTPKIRNAVEELLKQGDIIFKRLEAAPTLTDGRTDETNVTDETNEQSAITLKFDFEVLYQRYPRKLGKQKGLDRCRAQIKTEDDYRLLDQAIARYKSYVRAQGTEEKYVKHFSTFMTDWRDWLDPGAGKSALHGPTQPVVAPVPFASAEPKTELSQAEIRSIIDRELGKKGA